MRQTFSDLIALAQNGAGKDTTTATQTFLKQRINARYEQVISFIPSHFSEIPRTFSTVDDQQYYHYPPQMRRVEALEITIGEVKYPTTPITSYDEWNRLNAIQIQSGAIPRYYFNRQRDFGIWPIPQDAYTGTIVYNLRAGGLTRTDYTTGTVTATENDQTITGAGGGSWSTANGVVADMWFSLADTNGESTGSWYRIASITDTTNLELESYFEETTIAGSKYIIGECPELPEELHEVLSFGAVADYFAMFRQSPDKAQKWNNMFWTGDWTKETRDESLVTGGLIGFGKKYKDRSDTQLIKRKRTGNNANLKIWGTTIT
jgi:hypothetical protein